MGHSYDWIVITVSLTTGTKARVIIGQITLIGLRPRRQRQGSVTNTGN